MLNEKSVLVAGEVVVGSEAFENLTVLCDRFGSRFFATKEEKAAVDFLAAKLRGYGLKNVKVEPYTVSGWREGKLARLWSWKRVTASLELLKPTNQQLRCISLANAPSTPGEGVSAELFNLEGGSRAYLLKHQREIKGKIVVGGNYNPPAPYEYWKDPVTLYRPALYGYLVQLGAVGFIFASNNYGDLPQAGCIRPGFIGEIPAIAISRETSQFILRQMAKGKTVARLRVKNTYKEGAISYNVIADLPGHTYPDKIILAGAHFDGHDISQGAMDDAAGACVILEAARALAKHGRQFKRTIRFCCFAAEELMLAGSTGYVLNHADEVKNIELMISADCAGISAKAGHGYDVCGPEELASYLDRILSMLGKFDRDWELPKVKYSIWGGPYGDCWPFFMLGVPTARFHDIPYPPIDLLYAHTTADTVDKVDPEGLKDAALVLALSLMQIADEEEIQIKHTPIEKIEETLEKNGIAENLRLERRWRRWKRP